MTRGEVVWAAIDLAVHVLSDSDHADEPVTARPHDSTDGQQCALGTLQQLWVSDRDIVLEWFRNAVNCELDGGEPNRSNLLHVVRGIPELHYRVAHMFAR